MAKKPTSFLVLITSNMLQLYRDLKPTNVLLDEDDRPVLMDLGSMNRARIEVRVHSLLEIFKNLIIT